MPGDDSKLTAPGLSTEEHQEIRRVMLELGLTPMAAAVEIGRRRIAAQGEK